MSDLITLHNALTDDWSGNGVCVLIPTECEIEEEAGGKYELTMTHPITSDLRANAIQRGMLIKAPVPARETPLIQISAEGHAEQAEHEVWKATTETGIYSTTKSAYAAFNISTQYAKGAKVTYQGKSYVATANTIGVAPTGVGWKRCSAPNSQLEKISINTELVYHEATNATWSRVTSPAGTTGYIKTTEITYLRTDPYIPARPAYQEAVPARQVREQLFRVYSVEIDSKENNSVIETRHISYDMTGNVIKTYVAANETPQDALDGISADLTNDSDFRFYTNLTGTINQDYARKNLVQAVLDPDIGIVPTQKAMLVRDNYDMFILANTEIDRGVRIRYGKNLLGITVTESQASVITRIIPVGKTKDGKPLLLPEVFIDSARLYDYPNPVAKAIDYDVQVKDATETEAEVTTEQAYQLLRDKVAEEYVKGCDLPDIDVDVDFVLLGDTVEYAAWRELQQVFLYDTVKATYDPMGIELTMQVTGYKFDAIRRKYTKIKLSTKVVKKQDVLSAFELPNGGVGGTKIAYGAVDSQHIKELAVLDAHIANIDVAKVKNFIAEVAQIALAKIDEAFIDEAWITKLTAEVVDIVLANIDTLIANNATISWAEIANLTTAMANIATAAIGSADISFAKVKDLVAGTAIITEGLGGKLYIDRLAVSEANIVNLTAGKLMVLGTNGSIYRLGVDAGGNVTATLTQVVNTNIADQSLNAGEKLISSSITARCLNVTEIFANSALIGVIKSAHIGAGEVTTTHISAPAQAALTLLATNAIKSENGGINTFRKTSPVTAFGSGHTFVHDESINGLYIESTQAVPVGTNRVSGVITEKGTWTVSFFIRGNADMGNSYYLEVDACDGVAQRVYLPSTPLEFKYVAFTFDVSNYTADVYNFVDFATSQWATFWIKDVMVERGSKASLWSLNPLDPSPGVKSSYIQILNNALSLVTGGALSAEGATFDIATDLFTIQNLARTMMMLEVANGRVGGDIAVFTQIFGNVPNTFAGGAIPWAGSFQASLNNIGKWLLAESTLTISGNINEDVTIPVFIGARLVIKFASGTKFTGHINFSGCTNVYMYADAQNTTNIIASGNDYAIKLDASQVYMKNLHISGKGNRTSASDGTYAVVNCDNGSKLKIEYCTVDRAKDFGILATSNSKVDEYSCKGGVVGGDHTTLANLGWGVYVTRNTDLALYDTCPFGTSGGASYWNGDIRGSATNAPTDGTTTAAPGVKSYAVSAGYTVKTTTDGSSSVSWGSGEPRQGSWSEWVNNGSGLIGSAYLEDYNGFGLLILTNAANIVSDRPSGKTIVSATFKLRRDASAGTAGTVACTLHQHGYTGAPSGAPNTVLFAQAADAVNILPNQEMTIPLNASTITNLNNGTCKGFGFKATGGYGRYDIFGELVVTYS